MIGIQYHLITLLFLPITGNVHLATLYNRNEINNFNFNLWFSNLIGQMSFKNLEIYNENKIRNSSRPRKTDF